MHTKTVTPTQYRPDIDGLRAIAILSVVAYHALPEYVKGGFVGVDIFFVISGFLISTIIINGLADNTFRFRTFYARRIKRIFPSLITVLITCYILGWLLLLPNEFKEMGKHILAGAGFVSNIVLWSETGYFDKAAELKPLLHLWSLGVEEQFYILFPLMVVGGWKKRISLLAIILLSLLASFALSLWLTPKEPLLGFYAPVTRVWELLAGSLLAYLHIIRQQRPRMQVPLIVRNFSACTGILLIGFSIVLLNKDLPWPGWYTLLPLLGSALLIASGPHAVINRYFLSSRAAVNIGLISYPLYLWHWPLLVFLRVHQNADPSLLMRIVAILISILLAVLTYHIIEKPIRFSTPAMRKVPMLCATMAAMALLGLTMLFSTHGQLYRFPEAIRPYVAYRYDYTSDARVNQCWLDMKGKPAAYAADCIENEPHQKPLLLVWGDSHAARFFPGAKAVFGKQYRLAQLTRDSCPPLLNYAYANCIRANEYILEKVKESHPQTVILFAVWSHYSMDNENDPARPRLLQTIQKLKAAGVANIIVVGPAPEWKQFLPEVLVRNAMKTASLQIPSRTTMQLDTSAAIIDTKMKEQLKAMPGVTYVSALDAMCNAQGCLTTTNDTAEGLVTWDHGHLTTAGATYLADKIRLVLEKRK